MKKDMLLVVALIFSGLLLASMFVATPVQASPSKGGRADLDITFYASPDAAWTALTTGQADYMVWALEKTQKEAAEADPNIELARVDENGMYEFDLNNNYTIITYPGVRSATNEVKVRQAIAYLVDKDYIVANILEYFGVRIDLPIAAPQSTWMNESVIGTNYPYPYNPDRAAELLAAAGFNDTDGNGWLNYPPDWDGAPGADTTQYPLVVCIRSDHTHRRLAGEYLIAQLETTLAAAHWPAGYKGGGFKTTGSQWEQPRSVLSPKVMGNRDYQIYTGGWSLGRYPTYLYSLFHSDFWYAYGPNYVTGMNALNQPNYPLLDQYAAAIWYTADIPSAMAAAKKFGGLFNELAINIPLWSYSSYWAYRKELVGVVNENGYGIENAYTYLNAFRAGAPDQPIRVAVTNGPDRLNILYSQWYFEYSVLDRIYNSLMSVQPYNLAVDQPWVAKDWEQGTYDDAGTTKSVVTYWLRKDVTIVAPETGTPIRNFTAKDMAFTIWYNYAFDDSWQWGGFQDVRYTEIVDNYTIKVYFDDQSYWFYTAPTYPLLPRDELLPKLCNQTTDTIVYNGPTNGTDEATLSDNVVEVVSASIDGTPLVEGVDYRIRAGYDVYKHIIFQPLYNLTGTVTITYWRPSKPATGFYLAGLDWKETTYSLGTHYIASMTTNPPGVGDTIVLKKNQYYFLETPLLGEIDWKWIWTGTTKPRSGYYKIEIYDVVKATASYCHKGTGTFDPSYFPGADLDSNDLGHIGIYDLVTITGKYANTFGAPPA